LIDWDYHWVLLERGGGIRRERAGRERRRREKRKGRREYRWHP